MAKSVSLLVTIFFFFTTDVHAQTAPNMKSNQNNIRDEAFIATEAKPFIPDLPREFFSSMNNLGQARSDAAFVHTFHTRAMPCAKTINGQVEILATALNRGAANDRIGMFRRGLAIGDTKQLWNRPIKRNLKERINYTLSRNQLDSLNNEGRITIIIQDDTKIDALTLRIRRDYTNCRNNLIS